MVLTLPRHSSEIQYRVFLKVYLVKKQLINGQLFLQSMDQILLLGCILVLQILKKLLQNYKKMPQKDSILPKMENQKVSIIIQWLS